MVKLDSHHTVLLIVLSAVVIASGCIQSSSTDLNSDFNLEYEQVDLNNSGSEIYQTSMNQAANVTDYSVNADNKMVMNLPVISISTNMTSEGSFEPESYEANSSGTMSFNVGGNSNATEFNTRISSSENGTEVEKEIMGRQNQTEEQYSREELGISLESLNSIDVENVSVIGVTELDGEESILLDVGVNSSDLISNSERVFEVHSPLQESTDEGGDMSDVGRFDEVNAYLWVDREDRMPSKFTYYGSTQNSFLQVRSVTEFDEG